MAPIKKHLTMIDKAKALAWKDTKMTYIANSSKTSLLPVLHRTSFLKGNTFTLPECSPDLNPIENIFADLKRKLSKENISSVKDLEKQIRNFWSKLQKPYLTKLVNTMSKRDYRKL